MKYIIGTLALLVTISTSSCSLITKIPSNPTVQGIIDCGETAVATAAQQLLSQVSSIIASGAANWRDKLEALAKSDGEAALACAVAQATEDFKTNALASASALNAERGATNGSAYLAEHKYQFAPAKQ